MNYFTIEGMFLLDDFYQLIHNTLKYFFRVIKIYIEHISALNSQNKSCLSYQLSSPSLPRAIKQYVDVAVQNYNLHVELVLNFCAS